MNNRCVHSENKNSWYSLSDKVRFLFIGALNAAVSYSIFSLLCYVIGEEYYQISLIGSWIISSVISFMTQKCFVFNVEGNLLKQYCRCCITWFFSYLINAFLLEIFIRNIALNVYFAQILAAFVCGVLTYVLFKTFAFRRIK